MAYLSLEEFDASLKEYMQSEPGLDSTTFSDTTAPPEPVSPQQVTPAPKSGSLFPPLGSSLFETQSPQLWADSLKATDEAKYQKNNPYHRTSDYDSVIEKYAAKYGMNPAFVKANMIIESGGNPKAISSANAIGLMQIIPGTFKEIQQDLPHLDNPYDPEQSIEAGTFYLAKLKRIFGDDPDVITAAYNMGPQGMQNYLAGKQGLPGETKKHIGKFREVFSSLINEPAPTGSTIQRQKRTPTPEVRAWLSRRLGYDPYGEQEPQGQQGSVLSMDEFSSSLDEYQKSLKGAPKIDDQGFFSKLGSDIAGGGVDALEGMLRAVKTLDPEGGESDFVRDLSVGGIERLGKLKEDYPWLKERDEEGISGAFHGGVRSAAQSIFTGGAGALVGLGTGGMFGLPVLGAALGYVGQLAPTFALAEYDRSIEEYDKKGIPREQSEPAAIRKAIYEGGFEGLSGLIDFAMFGSGKLLTSVGKEALIEGIKPLLKNRISSLAKKTGGVVLSETSTEMLTGGLQTEEDRKLGITDQGFWDGASDAFGPSIVASLIFSAIGGTSVAHQRRKVGKLLLDETADPKQRLEAVKAVYDSLKDIDDTIAKNWLNSATISVVTGDSIPIEQDLLELEKRSNQPIDITQPRESQEEEYEEVDIGEGVESTPVIQPTAPPVVPDITPPDQVGVPVPATGAGLPTLAPEVPVLPQVQPEGVLAPAGQPQEVPEQTGGGLEPATEPAPYYDDRFSMEIPEAAVNAETMDELDEIENYFNQNVESIRPEHREEIKGSIEFRRSELQETPTENIPPVIQEQQPEVTPVTPELPEQAKVKKAWAKHVPNLPNMPYDKIVKHAKSIGVPVPDKKNKIKLINTIKAYYDALEERRAAEPEVKTEEVKLEAPEVYVDKIKQVDESIGRLQTQLSNWEAKDYKISNVDVAVGDTVYNALELNEQRRQSRIDHIHGTMNELMAEKDDLIQKLNQLGVSYAEAIGKRTEEAGKVEGAEGREGGRIRVRDVEEDRLVPESPEVTKAREEEADAVEGLEEAELIEKPEPKKIDVTKRESVDRTTANVSDLAADYKARGLERTRAWNEFVKDRLLKPEINAKDFYSIFDRVGPQILEGKITKETVEFKPTHKRVSTNELVQASAPNKHGISTVITEKGERETDHISNLEPLSEAKDVEKEEAIREPTPGAEEGRKEEEKEEPREVEGKKAPEVIETEQGPRLQKDIDRKQTELLKKGIEERKEAAKPEVMGEVREEPVQEEKEEEPVDIKKQITDITDEELDALLEEKKVKSEPKKEAQEMAQKQPVEQEKQPKKKITKEPVERPKKQKTTDKTADEIIKNIADYGVTGVSEAISGLYELFGGKSVKSFPGGIDEKTYAKAKVHFEASLDSFIAAGKSIKEFVDKIVEQFGEIIKPYLKRFIKEKRADLKEQKEKEAEEKKAAKENLKKFENVGYVYDPEKISKAIEGDTVEKSVDKILNIMQPSNVFRIDYPEGTTHGTKRLKGLIFKQFNSFNDFVRIEIGRQYDKEDALSKILVRQINSGRFSINRLQELATHYGEHMQPVIDVFANNTNIVNTVVALRKLLYPGMEEHFSGIFPIDHADASSFESNFVLYSGFVNRREKKLLYEVLVGSWQSMLDDENDILIGEIDPHKRPRNASIVRVGLPDYRATEKLDSSSDMKDKFNFNGVGFGEKEWIDDEERNRVVPAAYDAFKDLAAAIGAPDAGMSLGGRLAIQFANLGHLVKRRSAAAAYFPDLKTINMTRDSGDGCLSHEFAHAFHDVPLNSQVRSEIDTLIESFRTIFDFEAGIRLANDLLSKDSKILKRIISSKKQSRIEAVKDEIRNSYWAFVSKDTHYLKTAMAIDPNYVADGEEMWARAFEAFIFDTLQGRNNYLVSDFVGEGRLSGKGVSANMMVYPAGLERTEFNARIKYLLDGLEWDENGNPTLKDDYEKIDILNQKLVNDNLENLLNEIEDRYNAIWASEPSSDGNYWYRYNTTKFAPMMQPSGYVAHDKSYKERDIGGGSGAVAYSFQLHPDLIIDFDLTNIQYEGENPTYIAETGDRDDLFQGTGEKSLEEVPAGDDERTPKERDVREEGRDGGTDGDGGTRVPGRKRNPVERGEGDSAEGVYPTATGNYKITDSNLNAPRSNDTRFIDNISAIRTLKLIESEDRLPTAEEKEVLAKYNGWGGMSEIFHYDPTGKWGKWNDILRSELSAVEVKEVERSSLTAYYTPVDVGWFMWKVAERLGFSGGLVLDPATGGNGLFLGTVPGSITGVAPVTMHGVEYDSISARIASQLYGLATIRNATFEDSKFPPGKYDLTITNVPFSNFKPVDKKHNKSNFKLHDYFINKMLDVTAPGSLTMAISTHQTFDNPDVMREISTKADLVGAIRLPSGIYSSTDIVTDILIFRKKLEGSDFNGVPVDVWTSTFAEPVTGIEINKYFMDRPDMVAGKFEGKSGRWGEAKLRVVSQENLNDVLNRVSSGLPQDIVEKYVPNQPTNIDDIVPAPGTIKEGGIYLNKDGKVCVSSDGNEILWPDKTKQDKHNLKVAKGVIGLLDQVRSVLRSQLSDSGESVIASEQKKLKKLYDAFVKEFGPVNGKKIASVFSDTTDIQWVLALEDFDYKTQTVKKLADIFTKNLARKQPSPSYAETDSDALAISLNEFGYPNLQYMASLRNTDIETIKSGLGDSIIENPETGFIETIDQYLSGNVRRKLLIAREMAEVNNDYDRNVRLLEAAQPQDIPSSRITPRIGASWIRPQDLSDFVKDKMGLDADDLNVIFNFNPVTNEWVMSYSGYYDWRKGREVKAATNREIYNAKESVQATMVWGTSKMDFFELMECALDGRTPHVTYKDADGKKYLDVKGTDAAVAKLKQIQLEFRKWLFADPMRELGAVRHFNKTMNTMVVPKSDGSHLTFPGKSLYMITPKEAETIGVGHPTVLYPHQMNAVWKYLKHGNQYLAHEVGTGKTVTMALLAMEAKRLKGKKKVLLVTTNPTFNQTINEIKRLYPLANVMPINVSTKLQRKRANLNKIVMNDFDIVVMRHQDLDRIDLSPQVKNVFLQEELDELRSVLEETKASGAKILERDILDRIQKKEQELKKGDVYEEAKEENIFFDDLGIDLMIVDESHVYKNVEYITKLTQVTGLNPKGSKTATAFFRKTQYLNSQFKGNDAIVLASGTALTNSIAELYNIQRMLQPNDVKRLGVWSFDRWIANYGQIGSEMEWDAARGRYKKVNTNQKIVNAGRLLSTAYQNIDSVLAKDTPIKRPVVKGGDFKKIIIKPNQYVEDYKQVILARCTAIDNNPKNAKYRGKPDNMLTVISDMSGVAIDQRLDDLYENTEIQEDSKIYQSSRIIRQRWEEEKEHKGVQLVFCDRGIPGRFEKGFKHKTEEELNELTTQELDEYKNELSEYNNRAKGKFSVYDGLKDELVKLGIPSDQIAFIHDAYHSNHQKRAVALAELFAKVNSGEVRVLIGSTTKCGTGVNIQQRVSDVHHLDIWWNHSALEQRNGRAVRSGNIYADLGGVNIHYYSTETTVDAFRWNKVFAKGKVLGSIMGADVFVDEIEDISDESISVKIMAALTSGNPLELERSTLMKDIQSLRNELSEYNSTIRKAAHELAAVPDKISTRKKWIEGYIESRKIMSNVTAVKFIGDDRTLVIEKHEREIVEELKKRIDAQGLPKSNTSVPLLIFGSHTEEDVTEQSIGKDGKPVEKKIKKYTFTPITVQAVLQFDIAEPPDVRIAFSGSVTSYASRCANIIAEGVFKNKISSKLLMGIPATFNNYISWLDSQEKMYLGEIKDIGKSEKELKEVVNTPWKNEDVLNEKLKRFNELEIELNNTTTSGTEEQKKGLPIDSYDMYDVTMDEMARKDEWVRRDNIISAGTGDSVFGLNMSPEDIAKFFKTKPKQFSPRWERELQELYSVLYPDNGVLFGDVPSMPVGFTRQDDTDLFWFKINDAFFSVYPKAWILANKIVRGIDGQWKSAKVSDNYGFVFEGTRGKRYALIGATKHIEEYVPDGIKSLAKQYKENPKRKDDLEDLIDVANRTIESESGQAQIILDLSKLGVQLIRQGHNKFKAFASEMKRMLGDLYARVRNIMLKVFDASRKVLKSELGAVRLRDTSPDSYIPDSIVPKAEAFKKFFGKSMLTVDRKPKSDPIAIYHGTADEITAFDLEHPNRKDTGWLGHGVYLTTSPELAGGYAIMKRKEGKAAPNVMPLYGRLENPYYATMQDKLRLKRISETNGKEAGIKASKEWTQDLIAKGYDGVILEYTPEMTGSKNLASTEIVIFNPAHVKSVFNYGTWDAADARLSFSLADENQKTGVEGPTTTQIKQALPKIEKFKVSVVDRQSELPEHILEEAKGMTVEGVHDPFTNTVYVVRENIGSLDRAQQVWLHEVVGHAGIEAILGSRFKPYLSQVVTLYGRAGLQSIADQYGFDLNTSDGRLKAAREKLAIMAEKNERPAFLKRLYTAIRQALRDLGLTIKLTDNDIRSLIAQSSDYVMGKPKSGAISVTQRGRAPAFIFAGPKAATWMKMQRATSTDAFRKLAEAQRDKPERAMLDVQRAQISQLYGWVLEHAGDIIHRMAEAEKFPEDSFENVKNKVNKVLESLTEKYGFAREVREQIASNLENKQKNGELLNKDATDELMRLQILGRKYANEHSKLQVFNELQENAKDAAVALGEWDFKTAIEKLRNIQDVIDDGYESYLKKVMDTSRLQISLPDGAFTSLYDKKPRFEIDDSKAKWKKSGSAPIEDFWGQYYEQSKRNSVKLSSLLDHQYLYDQYPDAKDINVVFRKMQSGNKKVAEYSPVNNTITLPRGYDDEELIKTVLHEIQHAIQEREGFAKGGSPRDSGNFHLLQEKIRRLDNEFDEKIDNLRDVEDKLGVHELTKDFNSKVSQLYKDKLTDKQIELQYNELADKYEEVRIQALKRSNEWITVKDMIENIRDRLNVFRNMDDYAIYRYLAGEIEARDTSARANLTQEQRRAKPPYSSENFAPEDAIVRFGYAGAAMASRYDLGPAFSLKDNLVDSALAYGQALDEAVTGRSEVSLLGKVLRSPEWLAHPVSKKIYQAASEEREEMKHKVFKEGDTTEDEFTGEQVSTSDVLRKLKKLGVSILRRLKPADLYHIQENKHLSKEYKQVHKILTHIDVNEVHWKEREVIDKDGNPKIIKGYRDVLIEAGKTPDSVIKAVDAYRQSMDKMLILMRAETKKIVDAFVNADMDVPKLYDIEMPDGTKEPYTLMDYYNDMGQLEGFYMPRIREPGEFFVLSKDKDGVPWRIPATSNAKAMKLMLQLRREGHTELKKEKADKHPESAYEHFTVIEIGKALEHIVEKVKDIDPDTYLKFRHEVFTEGSNMLQERAFRSSRIGRSMRKGEIVRGYIEDPQISYLSAMSRVAGGIAKGDAATKMFAAIMGKNEKFSREGDNWVLRDDKNNKLDSRPLTEMEKNDEKFYSVRKPQRFIRRGDNWVQMKDDKVIKKIPLTKKDLEDNPPEFSEKEIKVPTRTVFKKEDDHWVLRDKDDKIIARKPLTQMEQDGQKYFHTGGIDRVKDSERFDMMKVFITEQLRNPDKMDMLISKGKSLVSFKYLGFNPRTIMVNMTSLFTTAPAAIHSYVMNGKGSLTLVNASIMKAVNDYRKVMRGKKLSDPGEQMFMEELSGSAELQQYTRDAMADLQGAYGRRWAKVMGGAMWGFGKSEQLIRGATMLAAYRIAKSRAGIKDHTEAVALAKRAARKAHGVYNRATDPIWAMGNHPAAKIGKMGYTYMKFAHNYLQMLYDIGLKRGHIKSLLYAMAAPVVLTGVPAIFAKDIWMALFGQILKKFNDDDRDPEKVIYDWTAEMFGRDAELAARFGLLGLAGVDVSGSLAMGFEVPKTLIDLTGPFGGVYENIERGIKYAKREQYQRAAEEFMPSFVANISRAIRELDGARTRSGHRIWNEDGKPYVPSKMETAKRAAGFRPSGRAVIESKMGEAVREDVNFSDRSSEIYEKFRYYVANPNKTDAELQEILEDISKYNNNIHRLKRVGVVPFITKSSLKRQMTTMSKPTKKQFLSVKPPTGSNEDEEDYDKAGNE